MIKGKIVEEIIRKNREIYDNCEDIDQTEKEDFAWSEEKQALAKEIAALSYEDLFDLVALMDYGRDCYAMKNRKVSFEAFCKTKDTLPDFTKCSHEQIAYYLLEKGKKLSDYLAYTLPILNCENYDYIF